MEIISCTGTINNNSEEPMPSSGDSAAKTTLALVPEKEDFISSLPDDIIALVLSGLRTIEERAATSVLARRWRFLWKYFICCLNFNNKGYSSEDNRKFVDRVNGIIMSLGHEDCKWTTYIHNFNLVFDMKSEEDGIKYQSDVDGWLRFAFQKKVKSLLLNFKNDRYLPLYSLTDFFLSSSRSLNHAVVPDSLKCLHLYFVNVTGELVEYILTVSPLLEELCVTCCGPSLVNFTVSGPSLKLKHLEVCGNSGLKHLYIHHVNHLESLSYVGDSKCLITKDIPPLVKLETAIWLSDGESNIKDFAQMMSEHPHLETLALKVFFILSPEQSSSSSSIHQFPVLRNIKRLELKIHRDQGLHILYAALLDAFPILHKLKIQWFEDSRKEENMATALSHPHGSLKVLEVIGLQLDMGLIDYLIENTTSLEKMIVVTGHSCKVSDLEKQQTARALVRTHLEKKLTPGTELIIK